MPFIIDDLIVIGITALIVAGTIVIVEIVTLIFEELINWFNSLGNQDVDAIGFTVKEAIKDGKVNVIQGVFNQRTNKVTASRQILAEKVDNKINEAHRQHKVVLYN